MPNLNVKPIQPDQNLQRVVDSFRRCFEKRYNTVLIGGAEEPLYRPSNSESQPHQIFFRSNYLASALHEAAHWCIAGEERRQQEDYGYWYSPDGRDEARQALFERVEVKPQALEWMFSIACGQPFRVSADNLESALGPSEAFLKNVAEQAQQFCGSQIPPRGRMLVEALSKEFSTENVFSAERYLRAKLS